MVQQLTLFLAKFGTCLEKNIFLFIDDGGVPEADSSEELVAVGGIQTSKRRGSPIEVHLEHSA